VRKGNQKPRAVSYKLQIAVFLDRSKTAIILRLIDLKIIVNGRSSLFIENIVS